MTVSKRKTARNKPGCTWLGCRLGLTGLVAVAALVVVYAMWYRPALRPVDPATRKTMLLQVVAGESSEGLCADLKAKGLIRDEKAAWLFGRISGRGKHLQAGFYDVSAAMSARDLIMAISDGKVAQRKVAVVPGLRIEQIASRVERGGLSDAKSFLAEAQADAFTGEVKFDLPRGRTLEGYLFPATYSIAVGKPAHEIILGMLESFGSNFAQKYSADVAKTGLGLHKVVTLASLVEREVMADSERPIVAGVIMNRLRAKQKLQVDATVIYALGHHKTRVMAKDLTVNSPYNTYMYPGLPPGPICSPGMESLMAAIHPATTPYFFYVATGKGTHLFGRTYEEHLANIARVRGGAK